MSTVRVRFGPADHGRAVSPDDFADAEWVGGYKYELIDGRLYVSAEPDPAENRVETWLYDKLRDYSRRHPKVLNYVSTKTRVYVHSRPSETVPEPDVAAYADYPLHLPFDDVKWADVSPVLVCEVLRTDAYKDLTRNVDLFFEVPSIREYWVLDARGTPDRPTLIQHRRYGKRWVVRQYPYGTTFTTKLLPGFALLIDPRK